MEKKQISYIRTEIYVIPIENRYVVYAPLKKIAFLANAAVVNFLWQLKQGELNKLTKEESTFLDFLEKIRLTGVEGNFPIVTLGNATFKPTNITLFLTNRCNLRCIYCYASAGTHPPSDMPFDIAKNGIDFVLLNALEIGKKSFSISYHGGGEPTVNWEVLKESLVYAKTQVTRHDMKVYTTAATNGVFSEAKCQWIIKNLNGVCLSVDGLPEIQDFHRPLSSMGPSSNEVLKTIEAFNKSGFPYSIRMTVTAISIDKMPESIKYLLNHARPKHIQLEPVYNLGRGKEKNLLIEPETFIATFREAKRIADGYGVALLFSPARLDMLTNRFCRSCGEAFNLTPSGNVSACYEICDEKTKFSKHFIFGYYDNCQGRFVFDNEKLQNLRNRTVENIPWCQGCFCKWHCAGDCSHKAQYAMVNGEFSGHPRCEITQALVLDQILEKINQSNGIFWAENSS